MVTPRSAVSRGGWRAASRDEERPSGSRTAAREQSLVAVTCGFRPGSRHRTEALLAAEPSLSVGAPLRHRDAGREGREAGEGTGPRPEPGRARLLGPEKPRPPQPVARSAKGVRVSVWGCPEVPVGTQGPGPVLDLPNPIARGRTQSPAVTSTSWMWPAE